MNAPASSKPRSPRTAKSPKTATTAAATNAARHAAKDAVATKAKSSARTTAATPPAGRAKDAGKADRPAREKYVKGSYKIPKSDYALFAVLKERAAATGRKPRKNDLIRAGLQALMDSGRVELRRALERLASGKS